jgi:hypothetical protein
MKANIINYFFLLSLLTSINNVYAQSDIYSPVSTPKGSVVRAWVRTPEYTPDSIAFLNAHYTTTYPLATFISNSSATYNCHGYAWHITEGGEARWIGRDNTSEEDIYMSDSSYIQVNPTTPAKVSYGDWDHSALTDGSPTQFTSKWGDGPLMGHAYNYSPYSPTWDLKYFVKISDIIGPDAICNNSTTTYTITSVPGANYDWHVSSNLNITKNGNTAVVTPSGSGNGWIKVYVSTTGGGYVTETKIIKIGKPIISLGSYSNLQDMGYSNYYKMLPTSGNYSYGGTLSVNSNGGDNNDAWSFYANISKKNIAYWTASGNTVDVGAKTNNAGEVLRYTATNTCGSSSAYYTFFTGTIGQPPPPPLIITPNPASTQAEVSIPGIETNIDAQTAVAMPNTYTISIINSNGLSVYSAADSRKNVTIPTSNLKNGIYVVCVSDGSTIFQGNLVVNH